MTRTAVLLLRSVYFLAGIGFIVYGVAESSARTVQYLPLLVGMLLIFQGFTGG